MSVQRYRRKPAPREGEDQVAARYEPDSEASSWDLHAVAKMAGDEAEVTEVVFPSGKRLALAWYMRTGDGHPPRPAYVEVEAGDYLAFDDAEGHLYGSSEANWRRFYDLVTGDPDAT